MILDTAAKYNSAKLALETLGFIGMPAASSIDFALPNPVLLNANVTVKHTIIVTDPVIFLTP